MKRRLVPYDFQEIQSADDGMDCVDLFAPPSAQQISDEPKFSLAAETFFTSRARIETFRRPSHPSNPSTLTAWDTVKEDRQIGRT